jgi:hypothetical protein
VTGPSQSSYDGQCLGLRVLCMGPEVAEPKQPFTYAGDDPVNESDPSGDNSCGSPANCEAILRHNANALVAFNYFLKTDHFSGAQAAGFVGNLEVESGVDPDCVGGTGVCQPLGSSVPYDEPFGIAQWLGGRTQALFAFASQRGLKISRAAHSLTVQLEFVSDELGIGPYSKDAGWQERDWADPYIESAYDPDFAAEEVAQYFEGAVGRATKTNPTGCKTYPIGRISQAPLMLSGHREPREHELANSKDPSADRT